MTPGTTDQALLPIEPARRKQVMGGIALLAIGLAFGYFFMYRPVHSALTGNGELTYYLKGIMIPPLCLYMGVLVLCGAVRDNELRTLNSKGQPTFTKKGWWVMGGMLVVIGLTFAGWYACLSALGFHDRY